jgi:tetratricopeptide (TPR) repeat protein
MSRRAVMVFLLAVSWSAAALAADEPTPNALLRQGAELFKQQDYEGARAAFARAYELAPKAPTLFNLGLSELNSDHPVEAAKHLREYLTHAEEPAAKLESVRAKWLPRAEARTAQLEVFAPSAAEVVVDGIVQEHGAPTVGVEGQGGPLASIVVSAGEHDVSARQGAAVQTQHVSARGGELVELHFQRVPDATTPAEALGWSAVGNGQDRQTLERAARAKWITVIALGSGAVVAAGLGVGFAVAAENRASDFRAVRSELDAAKVGCTGAGGSSLACMRRSDDFDANQRDSAISTAAYVGAGVLAAASVATWMLWRTDGPRAASVLVRPMLGARTAGLEMGGHW